MSITHEVTNQATPLVDYDAAQYPPILEALQREGAHHALDELHEVGLLAGSAQAQEWGDFAAPPPRSADIPLESAPPPPTILE